MNGSTVPTERHARALRPLALLLLLAAPASASHLRHVRSPALARPIPYSEAFYALALARHDARVAVPYRLRALQAQDGLLPDTAFVFYLRWRRGLNVARFDHFHPHMGQMLGLEQLLRPPLLPAHPPRVDAAQVGPKPVPPTPTSTPEPPGAVVGLTLLAAGVWWRRRSATASA